MLARPSIAPILIGLLMVTPPPVVEAQAPPADSIRASRLTLGPVRVVLDGLISEALWADAPVASDFRQLEPLEGEPATEQTEIRIVYDDDALYVGVVAFDSEPDQLVARMLQRDRIMSGGGFGGLAFAGDDGVAILLDPFHDHRNGFVFATNPNGAEFDALLTDEGAEVNVDWRGVWDVAAARTADGWSAEFRIPWRTLRYPDAEQAPTWGLNVFRIIQRKKEETLWRSWQRDGGGFNRVSQAGHLAGLSGLPRPGLNLEIKPYGLGGVTQSPDDDGSLDARGELDFGLDVKSEIRPGLVLDLTVNTDFAQVEVDDEQVNLTQFDLFFPEKRDFFLENSGIFEFGQRGFFEPPPYLMFFSRNIGIGDDGEVPILGGARLTGRVGGQTVGFLSVVTDHAPGTAREAFNVARIKRDVGESNFLGLMVTDRRGDGPANTVVGADGQFYLHPTLNLTTFASRSFTAEEGGEGNTYQAALDWTTDVWGGFFQHLSIDPEATASSGFITRTDIRRTQLVGRRRFRPDALGLRRMDIRLMSVYETTTGGDLRDWEFGPWLTPIWESGGEGSFQLMAAESVVGRAFELADSVPVPEGRYRADSWSASGSTSTARPWRVSANLSGGRLFGGDVLSLGGDLTVTPTPAFSFTAGLNHSDVELPNGSFIANIATLRATWAFSTKVTTNALIQHNSLTNETITNIRFNLIHRPGSDLFLVFTEGRGVDGDVWDVSDRGFVTKLTFLQRF